MTPVELAKAHQARLAQHAAERYERARENGNHRVATRAEDRYRSACRECRLLGDLGRRTDPEPLEEPPLRQAPHRVGAAAGAACTSR
jgi:hypothetical protein